MAIAHRSNSAGDDQCFTDILYSSMGDINGTKMIYWSVKRDGKQATTLVYRVLPSSGQSVIENFRNNSSDK